MKSLVIYSSQTGNTNKLAETVCENLPADAKMYSVGEAPDPFGYDFVAMGFWLQAGKPDSKSTAFLERLKGHRNLFLFAKHGARPGSDHANAAMSHAQTLAEGPRVTGTFSCFGQVNPKVLEKTKAKPQPPVWLHDATNAVGHPDPADLYNLRTALAAALQ